MDDPYVSVVQVYAGYECKECLDYFDGDLHLKPVGSEGEVAEMAKKLGWSVEESQIKSFLDGKETIIFDWDVLCPKCRKRINENY